MALFLQQLHYWIETDAGTWRDGRKWVWNSVRQWKETNFPWMSESTIKRMIALLEEMRIVLSRSDLNKRGYDKTKHYTIDYEQLEVEYRGALKEKGYSEDQIPSVWPHDGVNLNQPSGQNDPRGKVNLTQPIPETTPETTAKTTRESAPSIQETGSPFVRAYRERFPGQSLSTSQLQAIDEKVKAMETWKKVLDLWQCKGWRPGNIDGLLDRYDNWDEGGPRAKTPTVLKDAPGMYYDDDPIPRPSTQTPGAPRRAIREHFEDI